MLMEIPEGALQDIEIVARELRENGQVKEAARLTQALQALRPRPADDTDEVLTTGEAARALGVRSANTIKRWVGQGLLRGWRRGGRVLVSKRSVCEFANHSELRAQLDFQREVDAALEPFDAGEEPLPPRRIVAETSG